MFPKSALSLQKLVVFCRWGILSFTSKEKHGLGVFENRVLMEIDWPKMEELT
jgi:hypothetical protein